MQKEENLVAPSHCMKEWFASRSLFSDLMVNPMHPKEAFILPNSKVNQELI